MDPIKKQAEEDFEIPKLEKQKTITRMQSSHKKHIRRAVKEMERELVCPYRNCNNAYGSVKSLNLHIKVKHNGGTQSVRESLASDIVKAYLQGDLSKVIGNIVINLPPGEIQKQADKLGRTDIKESAILLEIYQKLHPDNSQKDHSLERDSLLSIKSNSLMKNEYACVKDEYP